jgi:two-component system, sensor histidine kinase LadS
MRKFIICLFIFYSTSIFSKGTVVLKETNSSIPIWSYLEILEDTSGSLTIDEVSQPSKQSLFKPNLDPVPNFGISNSAFWVKFTIKNEYPKENWSLSIKSAHIHSIDLYIPENNHFSHISTGNQYPFSQREFKNEFFSFLTEFPAEESTYYIRFHNTHDALFVPLEIYPASLLIEEFINANYFYGIYYGIILSMLLYNLFIYLSIREKSYLFYIIFLFFFGLHMLKDNGLAYKYLWPDFPEWNRLSYAFTIPMANIPAILFTKSFLETKKNALRLNRLLNFFIVTLIFVPIIVYYLNGLATTIEIETAQAGINTIFLYSVAVYVYLKGFQSAGYFLLAWSSFLGGGLVVVLMNFDILPYNFFTAYGLQIGNGMEVTLLSLSLANKIRIIRKEKEDAQNFAIQKQNESIETLKNADKLKDEFLANTSHELKTPLNAIISLTENIISDTEGKTNLKMNENLKFILTSGKRLNNLINDILDLSKLKNNQLELNLQPVSLKNILQIVLYSCDKLIKNKPIKIIDDVEMETPFVLADEDRLQQILFNLIGNAIKFTEKGEIRISCLHETGISASQENYKKFIVSISDTGIGIPSDKLDDVFNSFEQIDGSIQRLYGGTGLGLTITKKLVELHGGKIWVESSFGEGSTFYFSLEKRNIELEKIQENRIFSHYTIESNSQNLNQSETPPKNKPLYTILVVDDEPINIQVLKNHLSDSYHIISCMDGFSALNTIYNQKIDLVLLDLMMPTMSGYEVAENIRNKYSLSSLPIIILTAKNQITDILDSFRFGANDYIEKPFSGDELRVRIKTQLDLKNLNDNLENEVVQRTSELESAKKKIEYLTSFTRLLSEQNDIKEIFIKISEYIYNNYKIDISCLFLPNHSNNALEVFRFYSYANLSSELISEIENLSIDLNNKNEVIVHIFTNQKNFYVNSKLLDKFHEFYSKEPLETSQLGQDADEVDKLFSKKLNTKSVIIVPLVVQKETIGVYAFTSYSKEIEVSRKSAFDIFTFCRLLSGSIHSILLQTKDRISNKQIQNN